MLRIERSIQIANSQVNYVSSSISDPSGAAFVPASSSSSGAKGIDGMAAAAEAAAVGQKRNLEGAFVSGSSNSKAADFGREIDIDNGMDCSEEVATSVPSSLYGNMLS